MSGHGLCSFLYGILVNLGHGAVIKLCSTVGEMTILPGSSIFEIFSKKSFGIPAADKISDPPKLLDKISASVTRKCDPLL